MPLLAAVGILKLMAKDFLIQFFIAVKIQIFLKFNFHHFMSKMAILGLKKTDFDP